MKTSNLTQNAHSWNILVFQFFAISTRYGVLSFAHPWMARDHITRCLRLRFCDVLPIRLHDMIQRSDRSHVFCQVMLRYCYSKREKHLWNAKRIELLSNIDRTGAASLRPQTAQHTACLTAIIPALKRQCS